MTLSIRTCLLCGALALAPTTALRAQQVEPQQVPSQDSTAAPAPSASSSPQFNAAFGQPAADQPVTNQPVVQPVPPAEPIEHWTLADARALAGVIAAIGSEGLDPADYQPDALANAITSGEGAAIDLIASRSFAWLIEDLRDGRTPMSARKQWFVVDPDPDVLPTAGVMAAALANHDIAHVVDELAPTNPDYAALRQALADTPATDTARIAMIRANMDRWRWLAHDLGKQYLMTNVPEYQLRLTVNDKIIRTYKTIVGKPGKTATPQLAETVENIVFNPTWTVPQSIVVGEGLGAKALANPAWAKANGYKATKAADGTIYVVQQPGPTNSLGIVKIDMPNPHAIYLHDTPSKGLFNTDRRAYSHGCIRTERALELGITLAILGGVDKDEAVADSVSGEYTKVPLAKTMPVYITYFTMGRDIDGKLRSFDDIYGRDAAVLASFDQPRIAARARVTSEKVEAIAEPGA
jgi:murein L,D-transpeptidase YcbB/YkuD